MGLLRLFTLEVALERVQNKAGSASVSKIGRIMGDPWGIVSQHLHACMRARTHTQACAGGPCGWSVFRKRSSRTARSQSVVAVYSDAMESH